MQLMGAVSVVVTAVMALDRHVMLGVELWVKAPVNVRFHLPTFIHSQLHTVTPLIPPVPPLAQPVTI